MESSQMIGYMALILIIIALGFYAIWLKTMLNHSNRQLVKALKYQTISVGISMMWFREMNAARLKYRKVWLIIAKELHSPDGELAYHRDIATASDWLRYKGVEEPMILEPVDAELFEKSLKAHESEIASFPRINL